VSIEEVVISLDVDEFVAISEDGRAVAGFDENGLLCREWIGDIAPAGENLVCVEANERLTLRSTQVSWPTGQGPMLFDNARLIRDSYVVDFEDSVAFTLPQFGASLTARAYHAETEAMVFWDQELIETGPSGDVVNQYNDVTTPPQTVTWLADGTILADQSGTDEVIQIRGGQSTVVHTEEESTLLLDASPTGNAALVLDRNKVIRLSPAPVSIVNFDTGEAAPLPLPAERAIFIDAWFYQDETVVFGLWVSLVDDGSESTLSVIELDDDLAATSDWITLQEWQQDGPDLSQGAVIGRSDSEMVLLARDGLRRITFTYD
jgi:hypothetical protein